MAPSSIEKEIKKLETELKGNPDSLAFARLADNYRKKGDIEKAIKICSNGLLKYPFYTTAKLILGKCYLEQERYAEALQTFKEVCREDHRNFVAIKNIADIFVKQGLMEKGGALYLLLTKMDPANTTFSSIAAKYPVSKAGGELFSILEISELGGFPQYEAGIEDKSTPNIPEERSAEKYGFTDGILENVGIKQSNEYSTLDRNIVEEATEPTQVSGEDITNRIANIFEEKDENLSTSEISTAQIEENSEEKTPVSGTDISERIEQIFSTTNSSPKVSIEKISQEQPLTDDLNDTLTAKESGQISEDMSYVNNQIEEQAISIEEYSDNEDKILEMDNSLSIPFQEESSEEVSGSDISKRLEEIFSTENKASLEQDNINIELTQKDEFGLEKTEEFYPSENGEGSISLEGIVDTSLHKENEKPMEEIGNFPEEGQVFSINNKEEPVFRGEEVDVLSDKNNFEEISISEEAERDKVSGLDIEHKIEEIFTSKQETRKSEILPEENDYPEKDEILIDDQPTSLPPVTEKERIKNEQEITLTSDEEQEPLFEDEFIPPEFEETLQFNGELFEKMLNPSDDGSVFVDDLMENKMVNAVTEVMEPTSKQEKETDSSVNFFDFDLNEQDNIEQLPEMSFSFDDVMSEKREEEIGGLEQKDHPFGTEITSLTEDNSNINNETITQIEREDSLKDDSLFELQTDTPLIMEEESSSEDIFLKEKETISDNEISFQTDLTEMELIPQTENYIEEEIIEEPVVKEDKEEIDTFTITKEDESISRGDEFIETMAFNSEELLATEESLSTKEEKVLNEGEQSLEEQPIVISGTDIKSRLDTFFPDSSQIEKIREESYEEQQFPEQVSYSSLESKEIVPQKQEIVEEKDGSSELAGEKTFALTSEQLEEAIKNSVQLKKENLETTLPEVELYEEKYDEEGMIDTEESVGEVIDERDARFEIPDHVLTPTLADIYFQQGQYELALKIYKRLLERNFDKEKITARIEEIHSVIEQQKNAQEISTQDINKKIEGSKKRNKQSSVKSDKKENDDNRPLAGVRINKRILNARKNTRRKKRDNS